MIFIKESDVGCNIVGVIPVSQGFVVFPDAQNHRLASKKKKSHVKKFDQ